MPQVNIPPPYRGPTRGQAKIQVDGVTVGECIEAVEVCFPGFREQIMDSQGEVHHFVRLFVNGEAIDRNALDTPVGESDEMEIMAAIAGG